MSEARLALIREKRLKQPVEELLRKAVKSRERANLFTQEELDYADVEAKELYEYFRLRARAPCS